MLEAVFAALMQATMGTPAEAPQVEQPAAQQETDAQREAREAEEAAQQRRCRARELTGSRLRTVVTCRRGNGHQDEDTRTAMDQLQGPSGLSSN